MKSIIITTFSIVAALIGAGFASGEEILCYFTVFGRYGIWGIFTSVLFFGIFIYLTLSFLIKYPAKDFNELSGIFKSSLVKRFTYGITIFFSVAVYGAMISALAEITTDFLPLPAPITGLIISILSSLLLMRGVDGVLSLNGIIGIGLAFSIVLSTLYMLAFREYHAFSPVIINATADGLVYSGYNLISMIPVLVCLSRRLTTKTDALAVSLATACTTLVIMGLVYALLSIYHNRIDLGTLPMLTLARRQSATFELVYSVVLSVAIITTLLAGGSSAISSLRIENKKFHILLLSLIAYFFSGIGFSNLINVAYRISGIMGIFVCFAILFAMTRTKKSHLL